jgi:hypothetical protein
MKLHLNFNHNAEHTLEALDSPFTVEETNEQLNNLMIRYMENDKLRHKSELAELIHHNIDYSAILYMATNYVAKEIESKAIKSMLREFLDNDETI